MFDAGKTWMIGLPLQKVQNTAAWLVFDLRHRDHVSPYLMQLHWLPVRSGVQFKLCTLMHAIHNQRSPSYLSDIVQTVATATTRCGLRLFDHLPLQTMSCRVHFPSSASGPSRMQVLLPGTAFQITFVASLHLQPSEDIWKRFYSLKFLTLPRTFNIVMSAGHLCKWTLNRRWWWWWWCKIILTNVKLMIKVDWALAVSWVGAWYWYRCGDTDRSRLGSHCRPRSNYLRRPTYTTVSIQ